MTNVLTIFRREFASYFRTPAGYVIAAALLIIDGLLFNTQALGVERLSSEVVELFFYVASGTTMIAGVLLSMRLLAEERQTGTMVLLATAPVRDWEIVFGKFLSAFIYLTLFTLATIYMPLLVFVNGKVSIGHILGGYLGLTFLGGAAVAIGLFGSAVSRSQLVAAIIGGALLVAMLLMWMLGGVADPPLADIVEYLSLHNKHFVSFQRGIVSTADIVFYISVIYVFLLATTKIMGTRRWR